MKYYVWGIIAVVAVVVAVYFFFDPQTEQWFPKCRFLMLTGYKCPGCGMQRMVHSLLNGDLLGALRYNAFLLTVFPLLLLLIIFDGWLKWLPKKWADLGTYVLAGLLLVSVLLWWVLRNVFGW